MNLFWIDIGYACFGAIVDNSGIVIDVAPIGKWMKGKNINDIISWVRKKRGTVIWVS